jgi:excisionase family DNA binding protein
VSSLPQYVTAEDVAAMLSVDSSTVYRWAERDASMPALRIGGVVRFHREQLLASLEHRTQKSRTSPSIRRSSVA